jgi:hypothetical protein
LVAVGIEASVDFRLPPTAALADLLIASTERYGIDLGRVSPVIPIYDGPA